jgi:hypothetical protein
VRRAKGTGPATAETVNEAHTDQLGGVIGAEPNGSDTSRQSQSSERDLAIVEAEIERLALLPDLAYQLEREAAAKRLRLSLAVLDKHVKSRRRKAAKKSASTFDPDELQDGASHIIRHPDILSLFAKDFGEVIAGEAVNGKLLYLVGTSRLFAKPMNAAIKGTSAGGKSEIRKRILEYFPPEDVVSFTSLSEKSLIYYDGDFSHKILSMGEATAADEQTFQDYLLRELMSEGRISHAVAQKVGGEIITVMIDKEGPVAFLVTTTRNKLHPENETRMLSLEIDDSENQTKKVLDKVAQAALHDTAPLDYAPWQHFQRWLAAGERRVVVPFAIRMVELIPPVAVRLRRDVGQVIAAIQAHALLHREQRDRDEVGRIVADIEHDYATVRKLMNAIIAEGSGVAVNLAMTETIEAVTKATIGMADDNGADAKAIAKLLKLDHSATWRRLSAARDDGYIVNLEQRKGMPGKYRATGQKVEPIDILPVMTDLADAYAPYTPQKSVQSCNRDEIAETVLGDIDCSPDCKPIADCPAESVDRLSDCKPIASGSTIDNALDGNGKSPPIVGLQRFSGGTEEEETPYPPVCVHCGQPQDQPENPILETWVDGESYWLHRDCRSDWRERQDQTQESDSEDDLVIPFFLRRVT